MLADQLYETALKPAADELQNTSFHIVTKSIYRETSTKMQP